MEGLMTLYGMAGDKATDLDQIGRFLLNFGDIQRIPENRKLPFPTSVYYFTYVQAEEG